MGDPEADSGSTRVRVGTARSGDVDQNRLVAAPAPLRFTVSRFRDYRAYDWRPFYAEDLYGEIGSGLLRGDPQDTVPMSRGFVYVFRQPRAGGAWRLFKVFRVSGGRYQELDASGDTVDHEATVGPSRPYAEVPRHFAGEHGIPPALCIVDSNIALSQARLRGERLSLEGNPTRRGVVFHNTRSWIRDVPSTPPSGPDTLETVRSDPSSFRQNIAHWSVQRVDFDGQPGLDFRRPDAFAEAARRNALYQERVEAYQEFLQDEERNKAAFVHQTIVAVLRRDDDYGDKVDERRMRRWAADDREQVRRKHFPVHYATEDLVEWLETPLFLEWLRDYNWSADDDEQLAGLEHYGIGIFGLALTPRGREHLAAQFRDHDSFFNLVTHVPEIRGRYVDPEALSNGYIELRKWNNVFFAVLEEFAAFIFEDGERTGAADRVSRFIRRKTGIAAPTRRGRVFRVVEAAGALFDVERIERAARRSLAFSSSRLGRSVVTFFEVGNVALAVKGAWEATVGEGGAAADRALAYVNVVGAVSDLAASGLLRERVSHLAGASRWGTPRLHVFVIVSGVVDVVVGFGAAHSEYETADYDTMCGWIVFAVGGAIIAAGAAMQLTGASVAVGSGGTLSIPGGAVVLVGLLVEALGLLWVWLGNDDELDEWLARSRFGIRPGFSSIDAEIDALNELMCKFEVDASFSDHRTTIIIRPRLFTDQSRIELTGVGIRSEARVVEYFFGDRRDVTVGGEGMGGATVGPEGATRPTNIVREDGRVTEIRIHLHPRMDSDAVSGHAKLEVGVTRLNGYERDFLVERSAFNP